MPSSERPTRHETLAATLDQAVDVAERHHQAGRLAQADCIYRQVLAADPHNARALHDLGVLAMQAGQPAVALGLFESALRTAPDAGVTLNAAGNALRQLGRTAEARGLLERAAAVEPDSAVVLNSLGNLLRELGDLTAAERLCRRAIELAPDYAEAHNNLGNALQDAGRTTSAAAAYRRALKLRASPAFYSNLLYCLSHDETVDARTSFEAHRGFGERFGSALQSEQVPHANERDAGKRLRVGFVSGDLRRHAVSHFIEPVWRHLDRDRVQVFAYANLAGEDEVTLRLKSLADHWCVVAALQDRQFAQRVRADGIDILIDLSGHTARNRLMTFALKPAPVQASWIGYPETTGLAAIDYYLADPHSAPPGAIDSLYVEKLVRMPASVAFQPPDGGPQVNALPALARGHFTFGSFNRLSKLGSRTLGLWGRVLQAVPDSRMVLGNVSDAALRQSLCERFAAHGVEPGRLQFHPRCPLDDYLGLHHEVDLVLDTLPYTGGTTTQHSLWMGVPVLTLAGVRRAERISTANLARVGLAEWSVDSEDAFVERAVRATHELDTLADTRSGLRQRIRSSPLRRPEVVTRCFEAALRTMWRRWCDRLPAQAFSVGLPGSD